MPTAPPSTAGTGTLKMAASDLRALAQRRLSLIQTARATLARTPSPQVVALSHPIGMRQCDTQDTRDCLTVACQSHNDATPATDDGSRNCRTVASPIACDNATPAKLGEAAPRVEQPGTARNSKRPPSWSDAREVPTEGARCTCCFGGRWWCEASDPHGWCCWNCHPPDHLLPEAVMEVRT